jgi:hypothetical protein
MSGFVIAAFHLGELEATLISTGEVIELTAGSTLNAPDGVFVYPEMPALAVDVIDTRAIVLQVDYDPQHILTQDRALNGCLVSQARIKGAMFHDAEDRKAFDHVLDLSLAEGPRRLSRGEGMTATEFPRKYAVMQAMNKSLNHLLPMDTAYICTETSLRSMAKRVIKAHQNDGAATLYSKAERSMLQLLEQSVRVATAQGTAQHVTHGTVDNKFLFHNRTIAGELHYDAVRPLRMFSLIDVDASGTPSLAPKA